MDTIVGLAAESTVANVGRGSTALNIGPIISGILTPKDWKLEFAVADTDAERIAATEAALEALLLNNDPLSRGYYVGNFEEFQPRGEDTQYETKGYGNKFKTREATISKEYHLVNVGVDFWAKMRTFDGKHRKFKWLEIDNQGVLCGTNYFNTTSDTITGIKGYQLSDISVQFMAQATGSATTGYRINVTYAKASEANDEGYFIATNKDLDGVVNQFTIQDVTIQATGVMVAKVVSCKIMACGVNLCETVPGLIVSASFQFENVATGSTTITLTSVAIVDGLAKFTFAGAGAGWSDGVEMIIRLVGVSTLSAAGFKYFESVTSPTECIVVMED